jgi:hypothetical protein
LRDSRIGFLRAQRLGPSTQSRFFTTKHEEKSSERLEKPKNPNFEQGVTKATKGGFLRYLCYLLVRQAKLDGSCQLQGTDQGSCSFAL